jgi:RHS repeat-associated protein
MTDWLGSGNVTSFAYDDDGNLIQTTLPSGTTTSVTGTYDNADALTDTSYKVGSSTTNLASLSRNVDELIGSTTPPSGGATTYGYDPLNRVTTGTSTTASVNNTYAYDLNSELTSVTPTGGSTTDLSYNTDGQLCWTANSTGTCGSPPSGATQFSSSTAGERLSSLPSGGHSTTYGWDQAGNLVCETAPNTSSYSCSSPNSSVTTSYAYDGDGLRMSDTPAGSTIQQFTWDVPGSVPQLLEDGTNYYLYGPSIGSAPLEQITISGSTPSYLISDTTGVREQVSSTGSLSGPMTYDSYGNRCSSCSISTPFGFEGGYTDATGLVYLVHRYYDPATEQFVSVDPAVDVTGTPYAFTSGDPVNDSDPSGLSGNATDAACNGGEAPPPGETQAQACAAAEQNAKQVASPASSNQGSTVHVWDLYSHVNVQFGGCLVVCAGFTFADGHAYATLGGGYGLSPAGFSVGATSVRSSRVATVKWGISGSFYAGGSYYQGNTTPNSCEKTSSYWGASVQSGFGLAWLGGPQITEQIF